MKWGREVLIKWEMGEKVGNKGSWERFRDMCMDTQEGVWEKRIKVKNK